MKSNRRDFLRLSGLAGMTLVPSSLINASEDREVIKTFHRSPGKHFNMSGYAAPKLETVRIGFIGLGQRGPDAVNRMSKVEGVEIKGLCDIRPEKAEAVKKSLENTTQKPELYTGSQDAWKKMVDRLDILAVRNFRFAYSR